MDTRRPADATGPSTPIRLHRGRYIAQLALFRRSEELYRRSEIQYQELLHSLPRGMAGSIRPSPAERLTEDDTRDATPGAPGLIMLRPEDRAAPERRRRSASRGAEGGAGALTRRQREVAALIAAGNSNREIAEVLVLVEGTVANHVENIMNRLGFRSRTQIGVWAVRHGVFDPDGDADAEPDELDRPHAVTAPRPIAPP